MALRHVGADGVDHGIGPTHPHNSTVDLDELLTVDDVATLLKVSRSWVYEHSRSKKTAKADRLPHIKLGKYVRFEASAVRAFLQRKCRTT